MIEDTLEMLKELRLYEQFLISKESNKKNMKKLNKLIEKLEKGKYDKVIKEEYLEGGE